MSGTTTDPTTRPTPRAGRERTQPLTRPGAGRLVRVELRKMFDTRAGLWLCASIVLLSVVATGVVIAVAPDSAQTFATFASAVGAPVNIVLPMIAILAVTSEWSQRSGLGTFTMVPQRGRVLGAKAAAIALVGVVSMLVALGVGALGTVLGSAITGLPATWDVGLADVAAIVVANLVSMAVALALGMLTRSSAAGIVGYFVFAFALPPLSGTLAAFQGWWRDLQPWLDLRTAQTALFDGWPDAEGWLHLLVASLPWLVLPLALGAWLVSRSEVS
jgi:hypothetical protein